MAAKPMVAVRWVVGSAPARQPVGTAMFLEPARRPGCSHRVPQQICVVGTSFLVSHVRVLFDPLSCSGEADLSEEFWAGAVSVRGRPPPAIWQSPFENQRSGC